MGSYHMGKIIMEDKLKDCINRDGRYYRYDIDYDCWYRVFTRDEYANLPYWSKYGWLWTAAGLTVFAAIVTYLK